MHRTIIWQTFEDLSVRWETWKFFTCKIIKFRICRIWSTNFVIWWLSKISVRLERRRKRFWARTKLFCVSLKICSTIRSVSFLVTDRRSSIFCRIFEFSTGKVKLRPRRATFILTDEIPTNRFSSAISNDERAKAFREKHPERVEFLRQIGFSRHVEQENSMRKPKFDTSIPTSSHSRVKINDNPVEFVDFRFSFVSTDVVSLCRETLNEAIRSRALKRSLTEYSQFDWNKIPTGAERRLMEAENESTQPDVISIFFQWQNSLFYFNKDFLGRKYRKTEKAKSVIRLLTAFRFKQSDSWEYSRFHIDFVCFDSSKCIRDRPTSRPKSSWRCNNPFSRFHSWMCRIRRERTNGRCSSSNKPVHRKLQKNKTETTDETRRRQLKSDQLWRFQSPDLFRFRVEDQRSPEHETLNQSQWRVNFLRTLSVAPTFDRVKRHLPSWAS